MKLLDKRNKEKQDSVKQRKINKHFKREEKKAINKYIKGAVRSIETKKKKFMEDEKELKKKQKKIAK